MESRVSLPIIDFDAYNLNKKVENLEDLRSLSDEICDAFSTVGACYIKNHGLPQESIDRLQKCTKDFFRLDTKTKLQYQSAPEVYFGYRPLESDRYNPDRAPDLMEAFVARFGVTKWPQEVLPEMERIYLDFSKLAGELSMRVLNTIVSGFPESDREIIHQQHNAATKFGDAQCYFCVRSNLYPEIKKSDVKKGQIRFGEHTDFGTLTLGFQDHVGGLEIKTREGEFIPVNPIPGTAVVFIGDVMQRWTSDKLVATKHRVVFPQGPESVGERQSLAAFFGPDLDGEIKCLDGTNEYEPITSRTDIAQKLDKFQVHLKEQRAWKQDT